MAISRVRHPNTLPADKILGPCIARVRNYDAMRVNLDVALSDPRKRAEPVELRQP